MRRSEDCLGWSKKDKPSPLANVHVLEWGGQEAAIAGRVLAGLGARVSTVEPHTAHQAAFVATQTMEDTPDTLTSAFLGFSKVALRLPEEENQLPAWLSRLIPTVDVFITSPDTHFRPAHEAALRNALRSISRYVWVRVDPYEKKPAGIGARQDRSELALTLNAAMPLFTALRAASSCMLGLLQDRAAYQEVISSEEVARELANLLFEEAPARGSYWDRGFTLLPTRDGWVSVSILGNWPALAHALYHSGSPAWIVSEALADPEERYRRADEIFETIGRWCRTWRASTLTQWAQLRRIPFATVRSPLALATDPQLRRRRFFLEHPSLTHDGRLRHPRVPIVLGGSCFVEPKIAPPTCFGNTTPIHSGWAPARTQNSPLRPAPLHKVRVLDFTHAIAGPLATWLLARYGAEVVKIDPPGTARRAQIRNRLFVNLRAGKKALELDAQTPDGQALLLDWARETDVVVDNFSVRVMPNWGLSYSRLRAANPGIVQARITGFGLTGPHRHWIAYAPTLHAWSGHTWLRAHLTADGKLLEGWRIPYADIVSALFSFLGILVALWYRNNAGVGTLVDISEYECAAFSLGPTVLAVANPHAFASYWEHLRQAPLGRVDSRAVESL